jgi:Spy/CpxP family protein refolding chaperone
MLRSKKMKNLITLISIFAIAGSLMAQDAGPRGQRGKRQEPPAQGERGQRRNPLDMDAKILEDLKLNEDQRKKIGDLKKATADKLKDSREKEDREKMREAMKVLIEKYQTDLKKILTKEQAEKYDKAIKELRKKK